MRGDSNPKTYDYRSPEKLALLPPARPRINSSASARVAIGMVRLLRSASVFCVTRGQCRQEPAPPLVDNEPGHLVACYNPIFHDWADDAADGD